MRQSGNLVESTGELHPGPLVNADLAPTGLGQRTWNVWHIAALWVGMSVCIPTYMLAASMIGAGLTWWQSLLAILLGNALVGTVAPPLRFLFDGAWFSAAAVAFLVYWWLMKRRSEPE